MSEPLLSIESLTVSYSDRFGRKDVVKDVSIDIAKGEVLGLVGESGAGKSITGQSITGLIEPPGRMTAGKICFDGRCLSEMNENQLRRLRGGQIGSIFQDPLTSLNPLFTIADQLIETIRFHLGMSSSEARSRAIELLGHVGIPQPDKRIDDYPHMFSGGMRQRVVIALAIAANPKLIIADEPTTALDVTTQAQIIELLARHVAETAAAILFISHDLGVIAQIADRVAVMKDGQLVECGATDRILTAPDAAYTRNLIACVPPLDRKVRRLALVGDESTATGSPSSGEKESRARIVSLSGVDVSFSKGGGFGWLKGRSRDSFKAVCGVSFEIFEGRTLGLVGESGSGKSTLARSIAGLQSISSGSIDFEAPEGRVRRLQMIFQDPFSSLNPRWRVGRIVAEPIEALELMTGKADIEDRVAELLRLVGLNPQDRRKYPHEFSGGQRQRISIARALAAEPEFLICDEPTSALDVSVQAQILNLMKDLQDRLDLTYLFITHDLAVVRFMADRIGVMKAGQLVEMRPTDELFEAPEHPYTKSLLSAVPGLSF